MGVTSAAKAISGVEHSRRLALRWFVLIDRIGPRYCTPAQFTQSVLQFGVASTHRKYPPRCLWSAKHDLYPYQANHANPSHILPT